MERVVFYRERGALPYDPFAYGVAIALVEVPYLILQVRALCHELRCRAGGQSTCDQNALFKQRRGSHVEVIMMPRPPKAYRLRSP